MFMKRLGWLTLSFLMLMPVQGIASSAAQAVTGHDSITECGSTPTACFIADSQFSIFSEKVANNTTSVAVDTGPGTLQYAVVQNNNTVIAYLKLYNTAQGSTTCGAGTPVDRIMIPASTTVVILMNTAYSTAITSCVTTGIVDSDATAPAASEYLISYYFN